MAEEKIIKAALNILYYSGASHLLRNRLVGRGGVLMLHHVRPGQAGPFAPNGKLQVTPTFLDQALLLIKARGFELVSMDEAARRLGDGVNRHPPFFAVTLDDGYRDNLDHALPVFRRHQCPFTMFCAPAITDGVSELWWDALEILIARGQGLRCVIAGKSYDLPTATTSEQITAWKTLYWPIRHLEQHEQRRWVRELCQAHGFDLDGWCRENALDWDGIREIAADPLCTIGAHSVNHFALGRLSAEEAMAEIVSSADRIEAELGERPRHFAYPYGDAGSAGPREFAAVRKAGFMTAVTTRKGMLFAEHGEHLTALPRVSLSGEFQKLHYLDTVLSGAPFALNNRFRRLNVA